ncbi:hypothetical protein [Bacillus thuringiensis]|uniref:hypothetical protein n=1 Tax=Bacillus thuringiensis TaxID=1428 RepID=UPI001642AC43|nr:hypothetical protein [Bacillus thuringiensis]
MWISKLWICFFQGVKTEWAVFGNFGKGMGFLEDMNFEILALVYKLCISNKSDEVSVCK